MFTCNYTFLASYSSSPDASSTASKTGSYNTTPKWMLRFAVTWLLRAPEVGEYVDTVYATSARVYCGMSPK